MLYLRIDATSLTLASYSPPISGFGTEASSITFSQQVLHHTSPLKQQLQQLRGTHPSFSEEDQVQVLVVGSTTQVPLAEFSEEQCEQLYHFSILGEEQESKHLRVFYDLLPPPNLALIFALNKELCETIEQEFGKVYYVSALTSLLRHLSRQENAKEHRRAYLHCKENEMDLAIFENHRLLALNSFPLLAASDAAYYHFSLLQCLGLDLSRVPTFTFGVEPTTQLVTTELLRYAPQTQVLNFSREVFLNPLEEGQQLPTDLAIHLLHSHS